MPSSKPVRPSGHNVDVFINCPFDEDYRPLFHALLFTVTLCGFRARCSLEKSDAGEPRIEKISKLIGSCQFAIHDISRTELDGKSGLPRFNMPLELGIFLGMRNSGSQSHRTKQCLVLDRDRYRFQKFISDIAGQDIHAHSGKPEQVIVVAREWLRSLGLHANLPGPKLIRENFALFSNNLPSVCNHLGFDSPDQLDYVELMNLMKEWIAS